MPIRNLLPLLLWLTASIANAQGTPCQNGSLSPADNERRCQCTSSWPRAKQSINGFKLFAVCESNREKEPTVGEFYYRGSLVASGRIVASYQDGNGSKVAFRSPSINSPLNFSYSKWKSLGLPASFEGSDECWKTEGSIEIRGFVVLSFENHNDGIFINNFKLLSKGQFEKCKK